MKKIISIIFIVFIVLGCDKDNSDYRTKFSGTYEIRDFVTTINPNEGGFTTIYYYTGVVSFGEADNDLMMNNSLRFTINEEGFIEGLENREGYGWFEDGKRFYMDFTFYDGDTQYTHSIFAERK